MAQATFMTIGSDNIFLGSENINQEFDMTFDCQNCGNKFTISIPIYQKNNVCNRWHEYRIYICRRCGESADIMRIAPSPAPISTFTPVSISPAPAIF
jgi:DNA-directed RNA polymerase subunit RPC12/RpoP